MPSTKTKTKAEWIKAEPTDSSITRTEKERRHELPLHQTIAAKKASSESAGSKAASPQKSVRLNKTPSVLGARDAASVNPEGFRSVDKEQLDEGTDGVNKQSRVHDSNYNGVGAKPEESNHTVGSLSHKDFHDRILKARIAASYTLLRSKDKTKLYTTFIEQQLEHYRALNRATTGESANSEISSKTSSTYRVACNVSSNRSISEP